MVQKILVENPYGISVKEIIEELKQKYGIKAERKAIYDYIKAISQTIPIETFRQNAYTEKIYCTNIRVLVEKLTTE